MENSGTRQCYSALVQKKEWTQSSSLRTGKPSKGYGFTT